MVLAFHPVVSQTVLMGLTLCFLLLLQLGVGVVGQRVRQLVVMVGRVGVVQGLDLQHQEMLTHQAKVMMVQTE